MREQLDESIQVWLRWRASQDISKGTQKQDKSILLRFLATSGNLYTHAITDRTVTRFFEEAAKTKTPASLRNDHHTLKMFLTWCQTTGRLSSDPMQGRRAPKRPKRERNRLHVSKFSALLDAGEARSPSHRIALALLLYTLGRDQEICTLRIRDLDLAAGTIRYVVHKTRDEDHMPICAELDTELRRWLTIYSEDVGHLEPHFYLVPSRKTVPAADPETGVFDRQIHQRYLPEQKIGALYSVATPALRDIGFPVRDENGKSLGEGAHTIRRSGARALFDQLIVNGVDNATEIVQSLLHHSSPEMTHAYIGHRGSRMKRDTLLRGRQMYVMPEVTQLRAHG